MQVYSQWRTCTFPRSSHQLGVAMLNRLGQGDQGMVRRSSTMDRALDGPACQLGQPDRAVLLDPAAQGDPQENFDSREDLIANLLAFISDYDQTAKPFAWTYSGDSLKVA